MSVSKRIYMDNHATTPVDPRVVEAMLPYFTEQFGNAASRNHPFGWEAEEAVETRPRADRRPDRRQRRRRSSSPAARPSRTTWRSRASPRCTRSKGNHIITAATEHKAVLDTCKRLETRRLRGHVPAGATRTASSTLEQVARGDHRQDDPRLDHGREQRDRHDPADRRDRQASPRRRASCSTPTRCRRVGKVPVDVDDAWASTCSSVTAHKIYGPKGVGALYVRAQGPARAARRRRSTAAATSAACARAR